MKPITRSIGFVTFVTALAVGIASAVPAQAQAQTRKTRTNEGGIADVPIQPLTTIRIAGPNPLLVRPIWAGYAPGDKTRLFVIEKQGRIRVIKLDTNPPTLLPTAFLDIDSVITGGTSQTSEQGLLGLAFHPNYQSNGMFWVYYTALSGADTLARFHVSPDPDVAEGSNTTGTVLFSLPDPESNHNGGWIAFKPGDTQGLLYIAIGDGGGGCDLHGTNGNGQNINVMFGKINRIDIDGADGIPGNDDDDGNIGNGSTGGYTSPPGNPFFGPTLGSDEIWDYGLRNPWRDSFDRETGDLYIGDVGQVAYEEVDFEPANSPGGVNYGWRCMEGMHASSASGCSTAGCPTLVCGGVLQCPVYEYFHDGTVCSITGGYCYRGTRINELRGTYFFADYNCSLPGAAPIWSFKIIGGSVASFTNRTAELAPGGALIIDTLTSFGEDYFGEIYICDQEGGEIFKIVPRCRADIVFNNVVDVNDLLAVITSWGACGAIPAPCHADVVQDGIVNVDDLLLIITSWGACPP